MNVYVVPIQTLIPEFGIATFDTGLFHFFEGQICSADSCPPPEYEVICDCDCESCPDGTCPVSGDGRICCYDTATGKSIKEIEIEDYCEVES